MYCNQTRNYGCKDTNKKRLVYNFGVIFFGIDHSRRSGLAKVIDNTLDVRISTVKNSYSDIVTSLMAIYPIRGLRIADAKRLSAQFSEKSQGYVLCSPSTILKMLLDKALEDAFVESKDGDRYKFSINGLFLDSLLDCGSYTKEIVDITSRHCGLFYIRATMCDSLRGCIHAIPDGECAGAKIGTSVSGWCHSTQSSGVL